MIHEIKKKIDYHVILNTELLNYVMQIFQIEDERRRKQQITKLRSGNE